MVLNIKAIFTLARQVGVLYLCETKSRDSYYPGIGLPAGIHNPITGSAVPPG